MNIYNLKLLEYVESSGVSSGQIIEGCKIRRVPGGWIFTDFTRNVQNGDIDIILSSVFVPFNDEFQYKSDESQSV